MSCGVSMRVADHRLTAGRNARLWSVTSKRQRDRERRRNLDLRDRDGTPPGISIESYMWRWPDIL